MNDYPMSVRLNEADWERFEWIRKYIERNRPDQKVTQSDVIRYALTMATFGIQREEQKAPQP